MKIWRFEIDDESVRHGERQRRKLTANGCNEPFKGRYWCPKLNWFQREACPFVNRQECENYRLMCGSL